MKNDNHRLRLEVFEEIISGNLRPCYKNRLRANELKEKLRELNTVKVRCKDDLIEDLINNLNFKKYGYRSRKDLAIRKETLSSGISIILSPKANYSIEEYLDIPITNDVIFKRYMELLEDAYVRNVIIARSVVDSEDISRVRRFATIGLQRARNLFDEARTCIESVQNNGSDRTELYVIFAVNIILIRLIVFYQKTFKLFIREKFIPEASLMAYFYKSINFKEVMRIAENESNENEDKMKQIEKGKINCQVNQLYTIFYDLREKKTQRGDPYMVASDYMIAEMLSERFVDKNGKPLSLETIRTGLNKNKPFKRPKGDRRLDI